MRAFDHATLQGVAQLQPHVWGAELAAYARQSGLWPSSAAEECTRLQVEHCCHVVKERNASASYSEQEPPIMVQIGACDAKGCEAGRSSRYKMLLYDVIPCDEEVGLQTSFEQLDGVAQGTAASFGAASCMRNVMEMDKVLRLAAACLQDGGLLVVAELDNSDLVEPLHRLVVQHLLPFYVEQDIYRGIKVSSTNEGGKGSVFIITAVRGPTLIGVSPSSLPVSPPLPLATAKLSIQGKDWTVGIETMSSRLQKCSTGSDLGLYMRGPLGFITREQPAKKPEIYGGSTIHFATREKEHTGSRGAKSWADFKEKQQLASDEVTDYDVLSLGDIAIPWLQMVLSVPGQPFTTTRASVIFFVRTLEGAMLRMGGASMFVNGNYPWTHGGHGVYTAPRTAGMGPR